MEQAAPAGAEMHHVRGPGEDRKTDRLRGNLPDGRHQVRGARRVDRRGPTAHPRQFGGTSVLLLSSIPFEEFGYRADLTRDPLPIYTYRVLSRIPDFVPLGGMMLGGIWWITHRREEVAAVEGHPTTQEERKQ